MWPETSLTVSFVRTFAVRRELQRLYHEGSIEDCFRSQTPGFGKVLIVSSQADEVKPRSTSKSRIGRTEGRDCILLWLMPSSCRACAS